MNYSDKSFNAQERQLLKKMVGATLEFVDAVIVARGDCSWNTIRLHFSDFSIDVNNRLGEIIIDEFGTIDEFGLLTISNAPDEKLDLPEASPDTTTYQIAKRVNKVHIFSDVIAIFGEGTNVATVEYPQAVILDFDNDCIVLDKEVWFSEMIAFKTGEVAEALIYDDSINWADDPDEDPGTHFEFSTKIEEI